VATSCAFCGHDIEADQRHTFSQLVRAALADPSVVGSFIYRLSKESDGSPEAAIASRRDEV